MELLNILSYFNQLVGEKMASGGLLPMLYFVLKSSTYLCGYSFAFCFFEKVVFSGPLEQRMVELCWG
jgi:hypothetical protein